MKRLDLGALACLAATVVAGCGSTEPIDHFWPSERCAVSGTTAAKRATAYLRREGGTSSLVVQASPYDFGVAEPYPSGPLVRFAVSPETVAPARLEVVRDDSDVRGPPVVAPGSAWLIATEKYDSQKPGANWQFGTGSLTVTALSLEENDTSSRDLVSVHGVFDLSGVQTAAFDASADAGATLPPDPGAPLVGGVVEVRCADDLVNSDAGAGD